MNKLRDKKLGTLVGLAVGDAMGAPYEFLAKGRYTPTKEYNTGGVHNVSIGEWTDDTSMALCLAQSLIERKCFDPIDQMEKYLNWYTGGYMGTRETCFDIGNSTAKSIIDFEINRTYYSNITRRNESGNGTIMRLAPIPMLYSFDSDLKSYAKLSSKTTHSSFEAATCAELLAGIINRCYLNKYDKFLSKDDVLSCLEDRTFIENAKQMKETIPSGYCIDTLEVAIRGFYNFDTFIDGLMYCISLGDDTDTVGAVYGQIAGAYYGLSRIPDYYKENLIQYNKILDIANKLVDLSESNE